MTNDSNFDDIRPYHEDEIPAAMQRIADSEFFPFLASYVYPGQDVEQVKEMIRTFRNISDFQLEVMRCVNEQVIARSVSEFSYGGIENISHNRPCLFVSNHRDIMLDSCLLQYILYKNGLDTTEITFGANLMCNPLVIDIGKSNKMFRVERSGNIKDFYYSSLHLSDYIRYVITEKKSSVWIAQRNGRTKDGNDATDQGIIKMFCMSKNDDKIAALDELNIVPVAVSYEWESCDILKTLELYESLHAKYIKKPGEDINSILTGLFQPKGKVHIEICKPISHDDLAPFEECTHNEYHKNVAAMISRRIIDAYQLSHNNYIAHDIRYGQSTFSDRYTDAEKQQFLARVAKLKDYDQCDNDILTDIFLGIYSNPLKNKIRNAKCSNI